MKTFLSTLALMISLKVVVMAEQPVDALKVYFKALETRDKELLKSSIHAPDYYKDSFVKMIDVTYRFSILDGLLGKKYKIEDKNRSGFDRYTASLSKDLIKREFRIEGDKAKSIPLVADEIPVHFIKLDGKWRMNLQREHSIEELKRQAKLLDASYTALIALLNGLIYKIDTLDTKKFSYAEAITMVEIQIKKKLESVSKNSSSKSNSP